MVGTGVGERMAGRGWLRAGVRGTGIGVQTDGAQAAGGGTGRRCEEQSEYYGVLGRGWLRCCRPRLGLSMACLVQAGHVGGLWAWVISRLSLVEYVDAVRAPSGSRQVDTGGRLVARGRLRLCGPTLLSAARGHASRCLGNRAAVAARRAGKLTLDGGR